MSRAIITHRSIDRARGNSIDELKFNTRVQSSRLASRPSLAGRHRLSSMRLTTATEYSSDVFATFSKQATFGRKSFLQLFRPFPDFRPGRGAASRSRLRNRHKTETTTKIKAISRDSRTRQGTAVNPRQS